MKSRFKHLGDVTLPVFSGTRVMMLPFRLDDLDTLPGFVEHYRPLAHALRALSPVKSGVCYLTIDEKRVGPRSTHRRRGLHVDGVYRGAGGGWGGGGGGGWGGGNPDPDKPGTGMLTVASHVGCRAWHQDFDGEPGPEGECDHLRAQCGDATTLHAGGVFWLAPLCVHESIPQPKAVLRQFVRLSLPSTCPWFEGYTVNPLGVLPTGPILPRRAFMSVG